MSDDPEDTQEEQDQKTQPAKRSEPKKTGWGEGHDTKTSKPESTAPTEQKNFRLAPEEATETVITVEEDRLITDKKKKPKETEVVSEVKEVQPLQELDTKIQGQLPTTVGIDLSMLTAILCPPDQLAEVDEAWEFETLFSEDLCPPVEADEGEVDEDQVEQIGRAVQQECRDRSRMPSSA
eukprot:TRINITY_DN7652_c0_g1_i7.p1 TRINITY_DN7652_c0_g1~~TRINITY_DN7652_c0_g1_i7.p1  ORF type:complete len:180 (-),score=43.89 TRINITY_DN7652_c0_g1_i7:10-549(-)